NIHYDDKPIESLQNSTNRFEFKAQTKKYENQDYKVEGAAIEGNLPISAIFNNDNLVALKIDCSSIKHNAAIINGLKGKYQGRVKLKNTASLNGQIDININNFVKDKFVVKNLNINGNIKYNGKDLPDLDNSKIKAENIDLGKIRIKNVEIDTYDRIKQESNVANSNNIIDWIVNYNADYKANFEGVELYKIKNGHISVRIKNHNINITGINIVTEKSSASGKISYNLDTEELESSIDARMDIEDLSSYIGSKYYNILNEIKLKEPITIKLDTRSRANIINNIKENQWDDFARSLNINAVLNGRDIKIKQIDINETDIKCQITPNIIKVEEIKIVSGENRINGSIIIDKNNQRYDSRIAGITKPELFINVYNDNKDLINKVIKIEQPVEFDAEVSGSITNKEDIKINTTIAATNIIYKGKNIKEFRSKVEWLDRVLTFSKFELIRTNEQATGDYIIADFNKERVYLKNVWGNITPSDLTEAISEEVNNALKPVLFKAPPNVLANGSVPMRGANGDIRFDIYAPELKWWKINPKSASCSVFWKGETMLITNFNSDFYGGNLKATLYVDFNNQNKSNLFFDVKLDNVSARSMLKDILDKPKNVEGRLSGNLTIKSAVIDDYQNWSGGGNVLLEDGLIWDIKVFGVFSSILNMISPGLGNSRAKYASASFIVTNGVVYSDDLEIRGTALKMQYKGSVDFNKKVDARVEAEVLSDIWLFGTAIKFLLKPLTKLFIYKVTGTIDEPALEPVYIPKILLAPFQPFKTIKSFIFPKPSSGEENDKSSATDSNHNRITPLPDEEKASK
ncbi:MAG: AsmA-like C-terminal region-containing protein, partial [Sulfolobaceae archaeon]